MLRRSHIAALSGALAGLGFLLAAFASLAFSGIDGSLGILGAGLAALGAVAFGVGFACAALALARWADRLEDAKRAKWRAGVPAERKVEAEDTRAFLKRIAATPEEDGAVFLEAEDYERLSRLMQAQRAEDETRTLNREACGSIEDNMVCLPDREYDALLEALKNPPPPSEGLRKLAACTKADRVEGEDDLSDARRGEW